MYENGTVYAPRSGWETPQQGPSPASAKGSVLTGCATRQALLRCFRISLLWLEDHHWNVYHFLQVWGAKFPCTVPLPGRYLTFQRTRATSSAHTGVWSWQTNINELYVTAL